MVSELCRLWLTWWSSTLHQRRSLALSRSGQQTIVLLRGGRTGTSHRPKLLAVANAETRKQIAQRPTDGWKQDERVIAMNPPTTASRESRAPCKRNSDPIAQIASAWNTLAAVPEHGSDAASKTVPTSDRTNQSARRFLVRSATKDSI